MHEEAIPRTGNRKFIWSGLKQKCKGARLYWIDSQETKICAKNIPRGKLWNEFPVAALENELIPSIFWDRYPITKQLALFAHRAFAVDQVSQTQSRNRFPYI